MNRTCWPIVAVLLAAGVLKPAAGRSEVIPAGGVGDIRLRTAVYDSNQVYQLRGYVGYEIDLQFESGEAFVGIATGDIEGLSFVSQDNHLFIKPRVARVSTNLTVLTTRRPYQFTYAALASSSMKSDAEVIFAVRFTYLPGPAEFAAQDVERSLAQARSSHNTDYWYCGHDSVKPVSAWDDGVRTLLRFAARGEQPAIFALNDDGSESLLNFNMEGDEVVVHRVLRRLVVRRGRLVGRIVNKGYSGAGDYLDSHTLSPTVQRVGGGNRP